MLTLVLRALQEILNLNHLQFEEPPSPTKEPAKEPTRADVPQQPELTPTAHANAAARPGGRVFRVFRRKSAKSGGASGRSSGQGSVRWRGLSRSWSLSSRRKSSSDGTGGVAAAAAPIETVSGAG